MTSLHVEEPSSFHQIERSAAHKRETLNENCGCDIAVVVNPIPSWHLTACFPDARLYLSVSHFHDSVVRSPDAGPHSSLSIDFHFLRQIFCDYVVRQLKKVAVFEWNDYLALAMVVFDMAAMLISSSNTKVLDAHHQTMIQLTFPILLLRHHAASTRILLLHHHHCLNLISGTLVWIDTILDFWVSLRILFSNDAVVHSSVVTGMVLNEHHDEIMAVALLVV